MKLTAQIAALHGAYWSFDRWYRMWWYIWPGSLALLICGWIYLDKSAPWTPASPAGSWARPVNQPVKTAVPLNLNNAVTGSTSCFANGAWAIPECTKLIDGGQLAGQQLARVYAQRASLQRDKRPDLALADYDAALKVQPYFADALNGRAWIRMTREQYDSALEDLNRAIDSTPAASAGLARYYRGYAFLKLANYSGALTDLNEAQKLQPNNADVYLARGEAERAQDNSDAALKDFDEFSRLAPKDTRGLIWRSAVLEETGRAKEALAAMESAATLDPGNATIRSERDRLRTLQDEHDPPK
jgi:tetratricopeptide (TPR) repeat protein